jgi:adenosylmethionine-8-amino-7-oxononanoate aminotransferase
LADSRVWHPFTRLSLGEPVLRVERGVGSVLHLDDGRTLIDGISSWWVNVHGHGNPVISDAIAEQARRLEHVIFAGFTHGPAETLATRLTDLLPAGLDRVFFSDNGSTAVEVALKMARQYWTNQGEPQRTRILAFEGAYHGDTVGAMSAGERNVFSDAFDPWLFAVDRLPYPATWIGDPDADAKEEAALGAFRRMADAHDGRIAALIVEPLVQGAGGMRMVRAPFLTRLCAEARERGILLVFDEVMTGFGRTGTLFALEQVGITPDFLCLSKGLTGGFLPLSVTVTSSAIQAAFKGPDAAHTFWHGHSYTANPLGCAAAVASLDLTVSALAGIRRVSERHRRFVDDLPDGWHRPRICGSILALDLITEGEGGYLAEVGPRLRAAFIRHGVLLRPLGDTVYVMAPYVTTDAQYERIYDALRRAPIGL